jgi:hypothetical protein
VRWLRYELCRSMICRVACVEQTRLGCENKG